MEVAFWVLAEVMDKQVPIVGIWVVATIAGMLGFIASNKYSKYSLIVIAVIGVISYMHLSDIREPEIARSIQAEVGSAYFWHSYAAAVLAFALTLLGLAIGIWRRRDR